MERYRLRVRKYLGEVSWNEAWELIRPLLVDPYSHVVASLRGHVRPAYPVEDMAVWQVEAYLASKRQRNQVAPARLDRPWEKPREVPRPGRLSAESRARREKLRERLGI